MSWNAFNSVINNHDIVANIKEKEKLIRKPNYSEDQLEELENKIINSYMDKNIINLTYYSNYHQYNIKGIIDSIDANNKIIIINNKKIYFYNILKVDEIN